MRFEFVKTMVIDFGSKASVKVGVSHPNYNYEITLNSESQEVLSQDFNNK